MAVSLMLSGVAEGRCGVDGRLYSDQTWCLEYVSGVSRHVGAQTILRVKLHRRGLLCSACQLVFASHVRPKMML